MSPSKLPYQEFSRTQRFFLLTAICIGAFISHFTAGVVNVSLPHFARIFQTNPGTVQWITTGYLLVITCLLPVMGKLADRYGYRLIHNFGYVFFSISSVLVAFSSHISELLILRMLQAIGAAMFQSTNIALITIHLPKEKRGQALGTVSTAVALGGMSGPIAGGFIAEWFSWNWLFLVHVPIALIGTWLAFRYIPGQLQERKPGPSDLIGALLFVTSVGSLIFGISNAHRWGWFSSEIGFISAAAIIAIFLLILWEKYQPAPFLPIKAFRIPAVTYGLIISFTSFVMTNTVLVLIPFYLSGRAGISSLTIGAIMTAYPILLAFTAPVAGHLSDRYGSRRFMLVGLCGMGTGIALFALYLGQLPIAWIVAVLALIGLGMGLIASPNNSFIMQHAPSEHVGSIGGMISLTRNAGMVFGAALALGRMSQGTAQGQRVLLNAVTSVFLINVLICIGTVIILGYGIHLERRRSKNSKTNDVSQKYIL